MSTSIIKLIERKLYLKFKLSTNKITLDLISDSDKLELSKRSLNRLITELKEIHKQM